MNQLPLDKFGITLEQKIVDGIQLLQEFESSALEYSPDGYYLCFSGGKDSVVVKDIAIRSGVKFTSNYSVTTIDPPELTRFIKHYHPDVIWHRPKIPMMKMIGKKGLPTRRMRWCCELYKEQGGTGLVKVLGVRSAESPRRAKAWQPITAWKAKKDSWVVSPILSWSDKEVWQYIKSKQLPYCSLYDEGRKRIGCVGCPMSKRDIDFKRWPQFEKMWRKGANLRWNATMNPDKPESRAHRTFTSSDEWFDWWMSNQAMPKENDCQMGLF